MPSPLIRRSLMALLVSLLLLLNGCASTVVTESQWEARNQAVLDGHILVGYNNFFEGTVLYRTFIEELCVRPEPMELEVARSAFRQLNQLWQRVQHLRLGPVAQGNRFYQIQMWPDQHDSVTVHVAKILDEQDLNLLVPENFAQTNVSSQGLPMMERILFKEEAPDDFQCGLLLVAAINLQKQATTLNEEWLAINEQGVGALFSGGSKDDEAVSNSNAQSKFSAALLDNLIGALKFVKEQKLEKAMTGEQGVQVSELEFWRSGQALESIVSNLQAYQELYKYTFASIVELESAPLNERINTEFQEAIYAAKSMPETLNVMLTSEESAQVSALLDKIKVLLKTVSEELPAATGLDA